MPFLRSCIVYTAWDDFVVFPGGIFVLFSVPFFRLSVGTGDRSKLLCTLKPRCGALHTRFYDYAPRTEAERGLIDYNW